MEQTWYLKKIDIFKVLPNAELRFLTDISSNKSYQKGEIIFMPGDPSDRVFLITGGRVKLYNLSPSGKESILFIFDPGEIVGISEIFGDNSRVSFAEALESTMVLAMSSKKVLLVLQRNMQFALTIAKTLGTRLMQLGKRFESVSNQNLTCRVAQILLNLGEMCGEERNEQIFIGRKITHQNIAFMIGAARQSVTELLNSFIKDGLIKYDHNKHLVILQRAKLLDMIASAVRQDSNH
jgi:CRP-like cAMP-binding protein